MLTFDLGSTKFVHGVLAVGSKMQEEIYPMFDDGGFNSWTVIDPDKAIFSDLDFYIGDY